VTNAGGGEECDDGTAICTSLGESNGQECSSKAGAQACAANAGSCSAGNSDVIADTCRSTCRLPWCGDGVADGSNAEFCDDGLLSGSTDPADASLADDTDNCPNGPNTRAQGAECLLRNVCGDGIPKFIDSSARTDENTTLLGGFGCSGYAAAGAEQCDNGNLGGGGPSVSTCTPIGDTLLPGLARCENNLLISCVVDANCILGGMDFGPCGNSDTRADACRNATCTEAGCGDDVLDSGETCDDGAAVCVGGSEAGEPCGQDSTACVTGGGTCRHEANGADGSTLVCNAAGRCNTDEVGDACRDNCGLPTCGDGTQDAGEGCDDGAANAANATCTDTCAVAICGDGKKCDDPSCNTAGLGPEECDDNNSNPNDGCRNNCTANICGDGIVNLGVEQCDDGNAAIGDGCSPACCKDASTATGLSEHYDAEECGIGEGESISNAIDPMGNTRIERLVTKLDKRWTKQLAKQSRTEAKSPEYRQCAGLRGLERKVDRSMRRIVDKSWVRGWLTDAERDSLTAVIDSLVELYKSSRTLIIDSSPSGKC
jgi:cysteine-rich repeat protein